MPVGGGTSSLTCPAVAWPSVLGSRQPCAVDILPLPLPGPGGESTTAHNSSALREQKLARKRMIQGKNKIQLPAQPWPCHTELLPRALKFAFKTQHTFGSATLNHSLLGQPVPPAFPLQELLPCFYSCQALSCLSASDSFPGPTRRAPHPSDSSPFPAAPSNGSWFNSSPTRECN